jgi:hypothetical protein
MRQNLTLQIIQNVIERWYSVNTNERLTVRNFDDFCFGNPFGLEAAYALQNFEAFRRAQPAGPIVIQQYLKSIPLNREYQREYPLH